MSIPRSPTVTLCKIPELHSLSVPPINKQKEPTLSLSITKEATKPSLLEPKKFTNPVIELFNSNEESNKESEIMFPEKSNNECTDNSNDHSDHESDSEDDSDDYDESNKHSKKHSKKHSNKDSSDSTKDSTDEFNKESSDQFNVISNEKFSESNKISKEDFDDNRIVIYQDLGHCVVSYEGLTSRIPLPKSVDLESLMVVADDKIIPFEYFSEVSGVINQSQLVTVIKGAYKITGKVISSDANQITVLSNNDVVSIRNYDMVKKTTSDGDLPHLKIAKINQPITVSYLLSGLKWNCIITALIKESTVYLRLTGHITTETKINGDVILVAGAISRNQKSPRPMFTRALAMESDDEVTSSKVEDYTKYEIGRQVLRPNNIIELKQFTYPIFKFYEYKINQEVHLGYRFKTADFLPSATTYLYVEDQKHLTYIGSTDLKEYQANNEVDIIMGGTSMVVCETTLTSSKDAKITTDTVVVDIVNHYTNSIYLVIKHHIGTGELVSTTCAGKRKGNYLEWYFEIPSGTEEISKKEQFSCTLVIKNY